MRFVGLCSLIVSALCQRVQNSSGGKRKGRASERKGAREV